MTNPMDRTSREEYALSDENFCPFDTGHYAITSELMSRVMTFVPSLSILRWSLVSSNWLFSISNKNFALEQANNAEKDRAGLLIQSERLDPTFGLVPTFQFIQHEDSTIVDLPSPELFKEAVSCHLYCSHHGMVLLKVSFDNDDEKLYLWNPFTMDCKVVLNLSVMKLEDIVACLVYSKKLNCYVAVMFATQMVEHGMVCKLGRMVLRKNEAPHFETFKSVEVDFIASHGIIIEQDAFFLGFKKDPISNTPNPNCVVIYHVDSSDFSIIKVPAGLAFGEARIVKHDKEIALLNWEQVENYPFTVHVSVLKVNSDSSKFWKKIGQVGPVPADETPVGVSKNGLVVIKEKDEDVPWNYNIADRIYYRYTLNNRIRETVFYERADFGVIDAIDYSDSLLFVKEL